MSHTLCVELTPASPGRYNAWVADGDMVCIVKSSHTPIYDAARALLAAGWSPDDLMTIRHQGATYDALLPTPIGTLAKWSIEESEKRSIRRVKYKPRVFA